MTDELPLAAEFPPATRDDWLKLVKATIKNRSFESLLAKTYDGLTIEPLYPPGREMRPLAGRENAWHLVQRIEHPNSAASNAEAIHDLENGATALTLVFKGAIGDFGFALEPTETAIERVLDGVILEAVTIDLELSETSKGAADHLANLVRRRGLKPEQVNIGFGHDPIGAHTPSGTSPLPWDKLAPLFGAHIRQLADAGFKGRLTVADARVIHNAGGSEVQELAYALAVAVTYLRVLETAGISPDQARGMIGFRMTADADQLLTVAKLRALRQLWARVEQACGLAPKPAFIAAETAWRMMTRRDPWINILRATIAAFSAGVGGANAITVLPFTAAIGLPDRFARRVARNTQLLLLEESNVAKVTDPAAGSGAIEQLSGQLAQAAWSLFQEIERDGGIVAALAAGTIQKKVAEARVARERAIAYRQDTLTGTTDFPHLEEARLAVLDIQPVAPPPYAAAMSFPPLPPLRLAAPFERLRDLSDAQLERTGARPRIFLANLGAISDFVARATFAKNFFEAGGIEALNNDGFRNHDEMVDTFRASGTTLSCLCASNDVYDREATEAAQALAAAGAFILMAGRPGAAEQKLRDAGVQAFIFEGCDALSILQATLKLASRKA